MQPGMSLTLEECRTVIVSLQRAIDSYRREATRQAAPGLLSAFQEQQRRCAALIVKIEEYEHILEMQAKAR